MLNTYGPVPCSKGSSHFLAKNGSYIAASLAVASLFTPGALITGGLVFSSFAIGQAAILSGPGNSTGKSAASFLNALGAAVPLFQIARMGGQLAGRAVGMALIGSLQVGGTAAVRGYGCST